MIHINSSSSITVIPAIFKKTKKHKPDHGMFEFIALAWY